MIFLYFPRFKIEFVPAGIKRINEKRNKREINKERKKERKKEGKKENERTKFEFKNSSFDTKLNHEKIQTHKMRKLGKFRNRG